jgi:5-bromo-4-chloroindolyl phosphate hydrolysis protein
MDVVYKSADEFMAAYWAMNEWTKRAQIVPIGLEHDGADYCENTADEAADRLEELRQAGYIVPQCAIDALRDEPKT